MFTDDTDHHTFRIKSNEPVAIGGIGGSGTRVVSELLINLGFYMGGTLNKALDNLWFTILMKNPLWFEKLPAEEIIIDRFNLFKESMINGLHNNIDDTDLNYIMNMVSVFETNSLLISKEQVEQLIQSKQPEAKKYIGWGWKEPNTHVFLPELFKVFDQAKYIHVIRNGLDMAFSTNQNQCYYWGKQFGVLPNSNNEYTPSLSLDYWIAANQRVVDFSKKSLNKRFFLLNFDDLCLSPIQELTRIMKFLDVEADSYQLNQMASRIKRPSSIGRGQEYSLNQFSSEQLRKVEELCSAHV
jgi:hypothetical protein